MDKQCRKRTYVRMLIYDLALTVFFILSSVVLVARVLLKGGQLRFSNFFAKLGFYSRKVLDRIDQTPDGERIWIHAVSLGEVKIALDMMKEMKRQDPSKSFIISVSTQTAWKSASETMLTSAGPSDVLTFYPLDLAFSVRRAIRHLKPSAIIVVETEIWPNFICAASEYGIPFFLVNARLSDSSVRGYTFFSSLFRGVFSRISHVYAQSAMDADRFKRAGVPENCISVSSSFKFGIPKRNPDKENELRAWTGGGPILLGGSIWPGEDVLLLKAYVRLKPVIPELKLVLVPRHSSTVPAIERHVRKFGLNSCRRSHGQQPVPGTGVYICDTSGELSSLYELASAVFVGKTVSEHGGQNMIEPCAIGKPVVVGPYTENFRQVMKDLLSEDAIVQIPEADAAEMEEAVIKVIGRFLTEPDFASAYSNRAMAAVEKRVGSMEACARDIIARIA